MTNTVCQKRKGRTSVEGTMQNPRRKRKRRQSKETECELDEQEETYDVLPYNTLHPCYDEDCYDFRIQNDFNTSNFSNYSDYPDMDPSDHVVNWPEVPVTPPIDPVEFYIEPEEFNYDHVFTPEAVNKSETVPAAVNTLFLFVPSMNFFHS